MIEYTREDVADVRSWKFAFIRLEMERVPLLPASRFVVALCGAEEPCIHLHGHRGPDVAVPTDDLFVACDDPVVGIRHRWSHAVQDAWAIGGRLAQFPDGSGEHGSGG